ncbi:deaminase [Streptosporangium nondiastaticum]|uniref:Deaminase n=2 Tax=Actinomycetes TaxID=1760 RepID=A0A9X7JM38_9ACTN|nr:MULTISPECIES: dihydrofolate reductase family protein [Actinomycetes]PSJ26142.1 deaminase [Streptosporangium nondiastaticum]WKU44959.1 dihydrofolate reductase family protein [Streptomyces sp. VNUA116]
MRKLTYFIATTIDGFIAGPGDEFGFMMSILDDAYVAALVESYPDTVSARGREAVGLGPDNRDFDTVLMGRNTYEPGLSIGMTSPYPHLRQYVVSKSLTSSPDPAVTVYAGDVVELVRGLKREEGKGIWLCGGASLAGQLREEIDEIVLKINPFVAGKGIPLFASEFAPELYELKGTRTFGNGVVMVTYVKRTG